MWSTNRCEEKITYGDMDEFYEQTLDTKKHEGRLVFETKHSDDMEQRTT